jgi:hypothetical protein
MTSVQQAEEEASNRVWPDLQAHAMYVNDVYNLAFQIQGAIQGKRIADIGDVARAQLMILMRITDFLRCIQVLTIKCYPEQAGTLAASIFELAHTAVLFRRSPVEATQWLHAHSIKEQVPRKLFGANWKELVKENCEHYGAPDRAESEYQVYEQLCWMKHSLPKNARYAGRKGWRQLDFRATYGRAGAKPRLVFTGARREADRIRRVSAYRRIWNGGNECNPSSARTGKRSAQEHGDRAIRTRQSV